MLSDATRFLADLTDAEIAEALRTPGPILRIGRPAPQVSFLPLPASPMNRPPASGSLRHGRRHRLSQKQRMDFGSQRQSISWKLKANRIT